MNARPLVFVVSLLAGCVAQPPARPAIATVPPLDQGYGRAYVAAGANRSDPQSMPLTNVRQVGPVYFSGKVVGATAQNEYIVVDMKPGTYEVSCSPMEPVLNFIEKRPFTFAAGETKYLVCDMAPPGGDLWDTYRSRTYVQEGRIDLPTARAVSYARLR